MAVPIQIPHLLGGVSRQPMSQRPPMTADVMDNVNLDPMRGATKRAGSEIISGLMIEEPENPKFFHWVNRDEGERFLVVIDPALGASSENVIQVFDVETGASVPVTYGTDDPRDYLTEGTLPPSERYRVSTLADTTVILNREVVAMPSGGPLTYIANSQPLRETSNANNLASWDEFPQPPPAIATVTEPNIDGEIIDDGYYYARQDAPGLPQGFYKAVSTEQPPWYERVRTEPANSEINPEVMPIGLDFDGSSFNANLLTDFRPRLSGDSLTNPGPSFLGNVLTNFLFYEDRAVVTSGERVITSRTNDLLNFWRASEKLLTPADPVDVGLGEDEVNNIDHVLPYHNSLICFTRANRQMQLVHEGPFTPATVSWKTLGDYANVPYVAPIRVGDAVYFCSERNFANQVWEYRFDPERGDVFTDLTAHAEDYIPAAVHRMVGSERHGKLFLVTLADPSAIYVNNRGSWYRWDFNAAARIKSIQTLDDYLLMVVERGGIGMALERIHIGEPPQDTFEHSDGLKTLGFAVRLDHKIELQGVYDEGTNTTTWTLPYADPSLDTIVLGPNWDSDVDEEEQRLAGTILEPEIGEDSDGNTTFTTDGQYATNLAGESATVMAGRNYTMRIRLPRQYVRDREGQPIFGNTTLLTGRVRLRGTGYLRVEVTPERRPTTKQEYLVPRVTYTSFDGPIITETAEFAFRILGRADAVQIDFVNDKPVPSSIVSGLLTAKFVPLSKSLTD